MLLLDLPGVPLELVNLSFSGALTFLRSVVVEKSVLPQQYVEWLHIIPFFVTFSIARV
jgi:hypothetical protein